MLLPACSAGARKTAALICATMLGIHAVGARAGHNDPAPVPDEVVQKLVQNRLAPPDPLPQVLSQRLGEAVSLVGEVEQQNTRPDSEASERDSVIAAKDMLLASKVGELESVRSETRSRIAATRAKLTSLGLREQAAQWDNLASQIESRFDRVEAALNSVRGASDKHGRRLALSQAKSELRVLHQDIKARSDFPANGPVPTLHQEMPQPHHDEPPSEAKPEYLSYHRPNNNLYAFLGNTLLAAVAPPTPASATNCAYNPADLAANPDVQITPEIQALAASLGYSPARMFQYVSQNIKFEPYYGSLKGATGTLYAKAGNATDQSSLLIALLRASNIPARYVKGMIQLMDTTPDPLGGRAGRWVGAKSYAGAAAILSMGQNPSAGTLTNASLQAIGIQLTHVWVEACVPYSHYRGAQADSSGSRWIPLDPSFKDITYQAGIATNVSFDYTGYLSKRINALPDEYFATQVESYIKGIAPNFANNTLADVPYVGTQTPLTVDVLPASLPYEVSSFLNWAGTTSPEAAEVPDSHRYKFNVTANNSAGTQLLTYTLSLPQTSLARTTLSFQGATAADQTALAAWQNDGTLTTATPTPTPCLTIGMIPVLKGLLNGQEGTILASGSTATPVDICTTNNQLILSVTLAELVKPSINSITFTNISAVGYHALQAYAYQASDRLLTERAAKLLASVKAIANPNSNLEETEGEFLHLVGLKYMRYASDNNKHIGQLDGGSGDSGNHLGLTASAMKVVYLFDIPFEVARTGFLVDIPGMVSRNADLTTGNAPWKTFLLSGYGASALEYYIWHENVRMDAVSTTRGLQFASESGIPRVTLKMTSPTSWAVDSANLCTVVSASCPNSATLYPAGTLSLIQSYYNSGYTITLPATMIQYGDWTGTVFVAELNNLGTGQQSVAAFIIGGGYAGGYTLRPLGQVGPGGVPLNTYNAAAGSGYVTPNPSLPYATNNAGLNNGYDPKYTVTDGETNVANGNMIRVERDFSIKGRGGLPFVFERSYNSRNPQPGPLGFGWTHSFNQYLTFKDDNANGIVDAPDTDTLTSSVGWTDGTGGEKLFQVTGTAAGVSIGSVFTRVPGSYATMIRNANGSYSIIEKDGMTYTFENVAGTITQMARLTAITDRNGNTFTLAYTGANLGTVTDGLGRALTFSYDLSNHITQIQDFSGRLYQYAYTNGNNDLTSFKNPLAVAGSQPPVSYLYYGALDGANLNHALKSVTLPRGNSLSYEYYATGKLFRRTDALNHTRTYTYNDFRRETIQVNERNLSRKYFFDQYGNISQLVEENGATHNYTYDAATPANVYNRLSEQSPEGYLTQYAYDANGNITQITNPSASTVIFSNFTAFNQPGKIKDANGNYALMKYDAKGNLLQDIRLTRNYCTANNCGILDPAIYAPAATDMISWRVNGYDVYGNRTSAKRVRDFAGQVAANTALSNTGPIVSYTYDINSLNPVATARTGIKNSDLTPTTQSASLAFDALGRIKTGIDADWQPTQSNYDSIDRLTQGTDPMGYLRSYQYDANGNPVGERLDLAGSLANNLIDSRSASYDLNDRKTASVDAGGNVTAYQYDEAGNVIQITTPDNYTQGFQYDGTNHVLKTYDQANHAVSRTLDLEGKPRTITDPNGNSVQYAYYDSTGDGRLKSFTDAARHSTSFTYDNNGNATTATITGADGMTTRTTQSYYDELNRPGRIVGPQYTDAALGIIRPVTQYLYDNLGNRTQVLAGYTTDPTGANATLDVLKVQTTTAYDDFGRKVKETDPLNQTWTYAYDPNNNLASALDAKGQLTQYTWNYGHQLGSVRDAQNQTYTYTRNALGQVTQAQAPAVTYRYGYDYSHRLNQVTDSRGNKTLTYAYSPGGMLDTMQDTDGNLTNYLYDPVGRLSGIWAPNYDMVSLSYDAGGRLTEKRITSGAGSLYTYNPDNTLASLTNKHGTATISSHIYTYDPLGNRATQAETINNTTINYAYQYDALNRLTQIQNGTATQQENYTYDPLGNRTTKTVNTTTPTITAYVYDTANQLKEIHSGSPTGALLASLNYDADGNLTSRSDTGLTLAYDALNRMTQATLGTQVSNYTYDDQGRRIQKTINGIQANYLYSGPDIVAEYANTWGTATAQYTHGPKIDDEMIRATATAAQYFHQDGLNSVVGVTNNIGGTDATQRFDAWGNKLAATGTPPRYGYTGREPDESGLTYYRARYYDPTTGRFTQRDPVGFLAGNNRYAYTDDNPLNAIDPFGLTWMYVQASGKMYHILPNGDVQFAGNGHSGRGDGFNNPDMQFVVDTGPIPVGSYTIGPMKDNPTLAGKVLRDSMRLIPDPSNDMGPRGGFLIHNGTNDRNSQSSKGCIVIAKDIRTKIGSSGDNKLVVISGKGGYTVGGLPGKDVAPVAPYAGNQN